MQLEASLKFDGIDEIMPAQFRITNKPLSRQSACRGICNSSYLNPSIPGIKQGDNGGSGEAAPSSFRFMRELAERFEYSIYGSIIQYLAQLERQIRDPVLGNVGTIISFRLGAADAQILEREFLPGFSASDFIRLPNYHIYLKLMAGGVVSSPFSAETVVNLSLIQHQR